jgi:hypothetical protein
MATKAFQAGADVWLQGVSRKQRDIDCHVG